jgi:hypothetical protein
VLRQAGKRIESNRGSERIAHSSPIVSRGRSDDCDVQYGGEMRHVHKIFVLETSSKKL